MVLVRPKTIEQSYQAIQEYIHFYIHNRFPEKLNGLSPMEYREKAAVDILFFHCLLDRVMCRGQTFCYLSFFLFALLSFLLF
ncbi:IS3 family transposase [Geobacillus sp. 44B]|nr:IS3 family transposase [Geobacillus sp. 44B]